MSDTTPKPGLLRSAFSGADNQSLDIGRIFWPVTHVAAMAMQGWTVYHGAAFDPQSFGVAHAAIAGSFGGALWAKRDTEPKP